jgi:hypothetical protein
MFWTIRWTDSTKQEDRWVVLEAESRSAAEAWGWKRGVPVVSLAESTPLERAQARKAGLLRKYTPEPKYVCCGHPVGRWQLAFIMLSGVATVCLHLKPYAAAVRNLLT